VRDTFSQCKTWVKWRSEWDEDNKEIAYGQEQNRLAINHFDGGCHGVHVRGGAVCPAADSIVVQWLSGSVARGNWGSVVGSRPSVSGTCCAHVVWLSLLRLHFYY